MFDTLSLPAEARDRAGKGASRQLRREGRVPAVIYGGNEAPLGIHVELKELTRQLGTGHFFNSVIEIEVNGNTLRTLPKDVAFHPVTDRPLHADFLRLGEHTVVHVKVPVVFTNEAASPGIKRGGVLNIVHHELDLVCDADAIPDEVTIDLTGLEVGDSIHIGQIKLPAGTKDGSHEADLTIATIVAPSGLRSEEGDTTKTEPAA
jgi:large subunit ribosomal protein L25